MPGKMYEYLLKRPLAVAPEALEIALALAAREPVPETAGRPEAVQAKKGRPVDKAETTDVQDREGGVRVIPITGPIFRYADFFVDLCGGTTVDALSLDLNAALADRAVKAVLLYVDSPGGEATGIGELADMIRAANDNQKPVWAYVHGDAASAAYWLTAAAGRVVMDAGAFVGSIGVVLGYPVKKDNGRSVEFVSSQSPNKRPDVATEAGKAEVQRVVDDLADVFIAAVAKYRNVSVATVAADFGAGGILIGSRAVAAGMADAVGSFEATLAELAKVAAPLSGPVAGVTTPRATAANPSTASKSASASASATSESDPARPNAGGAHPSSRRKARTTMSWKAKLLNLIAHNDNEGDALSPAEVDEAIAAIAGPNPADVATIELKTQEPKPIAESPEFQAMQEQIRLLTEALSRPVAESPEYKALKSQLDDATSKLITQESTRLQNQAEAWAGALVQARRVPAAARSTLAALYAQANRDDAALPSSSVPFMTADGVKHGTRVEALAALSLLLPTDAERFGVAVGGQAVFTLDSVARTENPHERKLDAAGRKRLEKLAGLDSDDDDE